MIWKKEPLQSGWRDILVRSVNDIIEESAAINRTEKEQLVSTINL